MQVVEDNMGYVFHKFGLNILYRTIAFVREKRKHIQFSKEFWMFNSMAVRSHGLTRDILLETLIRHLGQKDVEVNRLLSFLKNLSSYKLKKGFKRKIDRVFDSLGEVSNALEKAEATTNFYEYKSENESAYLRSAKKDKHASIRALHESYMAFIESLRDVSDTMTNTSNFKRVDIGNFSISSRKRDTGNSVIPSGQGRYFE